MPRPAPGTGRCSDVPLCGVTLISRPRISLPSMSKTAFLAPPRLAAALTTPALILFCALAGTAHAAPTDFCSPGVTTTFKGGGNWGDGDNWTDGQPNAYCGAG